MKTPAVNFFFYSITRKLKSDKLHILEYMTLAKIDKICLMK